MACIHRLIETDQVGKTITEPRTILPYCRSVPKSKFDKQLRHAGMGGVDSEARRIGYNDGMSFDRE